MGNLRENMSLQFGAVGWTFQKQFPDKKWYEGVVIKILKKVGNGKDRRCHYPIDDDYEDLSMADLRKIAKLEKNRGIVKSTSKQVQKAHVAVNKMEQVRKEESRRQSSRKRKGFENP